MRSKIAILAALLSTTAYAQFQNYPGYTSGVGNRSGYYTGSSLILSECSQVADDTTPDVGHCNIVLMSDSNSAPVAITVFNNAQVGQYIYLVGAGSSNLTSISNAGNFTLQTDWAGGAGTTLDLYATSATTFIEVGRTPAVTSRTLHFVVDGNRSDTYTSDGSFAKPYKTVTTAVAAAAALGATSEPIVIEIMSDTYAEDLVLEDSDLRYIVVKSYSGNMDVDMQAFTSTASNTNLVSLVIQGIHFSATSELSSAVNGNTLTDAAGTFINCEFDGAFTAASMEHLDLYNTKFDGAVAVSNVTSNQWLNNSVQVTGNTFTVDWDSDGVVTTGGTTTSVILYDSGIACPTVARTGSAGTTIVQVRDGGYINGGVCSFASDTALYLYPGGWVYADLTSSTSSGSNVYYWGGVIYSESNFGTFDATKNYDNPVVASTIYASGAATIAGALAANDSANITESDSATNTVSNIATLTHNTSGAATTGFGNSITFVSESASGNTETSGVITTKWTSATDDAEESQVCIQTSDIGDDGTADRVCIDKDGTATFSAGVIVTGTSDLNNEIDLTKTDSVTNTITNVATFSHETSATAAASFGTKISLEAESGSGNTEIAGAISSYWTSATDDAEESQLCIQTSDIGDDGTADRVCIDKDGITTFNAGIVVTGTADLNSEIDLTKTDSATNTITNVATFSHETSGTAAASYGTKISLEAESGGGNTEIAGAISSFWTSETDDAEESTLCLQTADIGDDGLADRMCIDKDGITTFNNETNTAKSDAATNSVTNVSTLTHNTSGSATTGFGNSLSFVSESASGNTEISGVITTEWTDATDDAEDSQVCIQTTLAATPGDALCIDSAKNATFEGNVHAPITDLGNEDTSEAIDFDGAPYQTLALTGDAAISATGFSATYGKTVTVKLTASGGDRSPTFDTDWTWLGTAPTSITSGESGILMLLSLTNAATGVVAQYQVLGDGT